MKRLFGLIGLTCLFVLTVVFYLYSKVTVICMSAVAVILVVIGEAAFLFKIFSRVRRELIVMGITALCACQILAGYYNCVYKPVVDDYSGSVASFSGYVCDSKTTGSGYFIYTVKVTDINGAEESFKLQIVSDARQNLENFDCVSGRAYLMSNDNNFSLSKGIFLSAYPDSNFIIESSGEKHFSLYGIAASVRNAMEEILDSQLDSESSNLCKAVLLGDKQALDYDTLSDFSVTGSSFLIVVSGMHLSIVAQLVRKLAKALIKSVRIQSLAVIAAVLMFMAVTGFNLSTVRSGIMTVIAFGGEIFMRKSDALNSIGAAALALLLFNPFAVGDVGLLLSFSATLGIILWSDKIYTSAVSMLGIKLKAVKFIIGIAAPSISAALWVIPVTAIAFGRISPYIVIISVITESAVSLLVVSALLLILLSLLYTPVISYFLAQICSLLSKYITFAIGAFADMPYASVKADNIYFYVATAVFVVLIAVGYAAGAGKKYAAFSAALCALTLFSGYAVTVLTESDNVEMKLFKNYNGVTVSVESTDGISFLSCGGPSGRADDILDEIAENYSSVNYIISPGSPNKYSGYLDEIADEFEYTQALIGGSSSVYIGENVNRFNNTSFTLAINQTVTDYVICAGGTVYQYVSGTEATVLFCSSGGDISNLPAEYRTADYLLVDDIPDNIELVNCETVIIAATGNSYKSEYGSLLGLFDNVLTNVEEDISIKL